MRGISHEAMNIALSGERKFYAGDRDLLVRAMNALNAEDFRLMSPDDEQRCMVSVADNLLDLPVPRLQLLWVTPTECRYQMALPALARSPKGGTLIIPMGWTMVNDGSLDQIPPVLPHGAVDTPFRDGYHARWDAFTLKLPVYAIWENHYTQLEPLDGGKPNAG